MTAREFRIIAIVRDLGMIVCGADIYAAVDSAIKGDYGEAVTCVLLAFAISIWLCVCRYELEEPSECPPPRP
jgi:hypothetical protein